MGSVEIDPETVIKAHVHSDKTSLFEVHHSKQGWTFNPSLNLKSRKAGMIAAADIDVRGRADTHLKVHLRDDGTSSFEANHDLDSSTSVKVKSSGVDIMKTYIEVNHMVDKVSGWLGSMLPRIPTTSYYFRLLLLLVSPSVSYPCVDALNTLRGTNFRRLLPSPDVSRCPQPV